jgi:hypothetical protein
VRKHVGVAVTAALLGALLAGCTNQQAAPSPSQPGQSSSQTTQPWQDEIRPAESGGSLGGPGTPCTLPVSFELAESWKPQAVAADGSALTEQGGFTLACEVDAKPAGNIGFLRVWTGPRTGGTAREALDSFLAADKNITVPEFRDAQLDAVTGAEVTYIRDNPKADVKKRERVLALITPHGSVVLVLGGLDTEEHEQMLPAYVLAKKSIKLLP